MKYEWTISFQMGLGYYFKLYHYKLNHVFFFYTVTYYDRESVTDFKRLVIGNNKTIMFWPR